jgi:hypothetical protein
MQAIVTKFIAPTCTRPSRVKATCQARSITLSWDHALNPDRNHRAAALATQLGWTGRWTAGDLPDGSTAWTLDSDRMEDALYVFPSRSAA